MDTRLLTRVRIRNFKSIAGCDVRPAQLSFLVGANGSGKSNFLDALRFVAESLRFSLDHALRDRGGIGEVRRRSGGHPNHFGIRLDFQLPGATGHFAFNVGAKPRAGFHVQREECTVVLPDGASEYYEVVDGTVARTSLRPAPAASNDRLFLVSASGMPAFRPIYDSLAGMGFYNLSPTEIRELQPADPGELLTRSGSNIASVLANLALRTPPWEKQRIEEYLSKVVPEIAGVDARPLGNKATLEFRQKVRGAKHPWHFFASSMSDGTLRALGVLVALFQGAGNGHVVHRLVGIEEPEVALHPAAAGVLTDSLYDASSYSQIIVTSHSPDLLDNDTIPDDSVLAVVSEDGETRIGPLDTPGRSALQDHLYTAGELLRMAQLRPDPVTSNPSQLELFGAAS